MTQLRNQTQIGKTGTITPVGELEPVELAGTTVSRCSLSLQYRTRSLGMTFMSVISGG
ncbi:MAG: hypothetical protein U0905_01025 [Pirellulales bacterium]